MNWTPEAEAAIKKVPFFVRKKVHARVEKEAHDTGKQIVSLAEVKAAKASYLTNMSAEVKGYQLDICFGPSGCPNRAVHGEGLLAEIEKLLIKEDLSGFLRNKLGDKLKFHHEFRITLADCPNACSQPQIKDIGIIGACVPQITAEPCTGCEACVEACREKAIQLDTDTPQPQIDLDCCLFCGKCIRVCPTGTLAEKTHGFRVQIGGKLGRHPQLARELPGIYSESQVLDIIKDCIAFYKQHSRRGERFAEIFKYADFKKLAARFSD